MSVITEFRTLFFGILAICVLFVVSGSVGAGNASAEYAKSPIWEKTTCTLNTYDESGNVEDKSCIRSYDDRLSAISADGLYSVQGDDSESGDWSKDGQRTGYSMVSVFYYNNSEPVSLLHECILGNDNGWSGQCYTNSVSISGDGSRIAVKTYKYYYCNEDRGFDCDEGEDIWYDSETLSVYGVHSKELLYEYQFCEGPREGSDGGGGDNGTGGEEYDDSGCTENGPSSFAEISKDGSSVIAHWNHQVFLFNIDDNEVSWSKFFEDEVYQARISDTGQKISVAVGEYVKYFGSSSDTPIWSSQLFGQVRDMDLSGSGEHIAAATSFMMVYSFDAESSQPIWEYAHYQAIYDLVISSSGSHILVSSGSGFMYFTQSSNSPLWVSSLNSIQSYNYNSLSSDGMMVFTDKYLLNPINGIPIWEGYLYSFISDEGNFVVSKYSDVLRYYTVNSQIFYPVAYAGEDTTKKTSQVVQFTGQGTDADGSITMYEWDFDGNGVYDWYSFSNGLYTYYYNNEGVYFATLRVTDDSGLTSTDSVKITISGISSGGLIDPKDDGEEDDDENTDTSNETTDDGKDVNETDEESEDIQDEEDSLDEKTEDSAPEVDIPSGKDEEKGLLPSIGIMASMMIISIIALKRRG